MNIAMIGHKDFPSRSGGVEVVVYELRNSQYFLSSLSRAQNGDFTLTAWYDKPDTQGGRVRVIVLRES